MSAARALSCIARPAAIATAGCCSPHRLREASAGSPRFGSGGNACGGCGCAARGVLSACVGARLAAMAAEASAASEAFAGSTRFGSGGNACGGCGCAAVVVAVWSVGWSSQGAPRRRRAAPVGSTSRQPPHASEGCSRAARRREPRGCRRRSGCSGRSSGCFRRTHSNPRPAMDMSARLLGVAFTRDQFPTNLKWLNWKFFGSVYNNRQQQPSSALLPSIPLQAITHDHIDQSLMITTISNACILMLMHVYDC